MSKAEFTGMNMKAKELETALHRLPPDRKITLLWSLVGVALMRPKAPLRETLERQLDEITRFEQPFTKGKA